MIEIKHRYTNKVLHFVQSDTLVGANLTGANMRCAYLRDVDLRNAVLIDVDLSLADLTNANLNSTNLRRGNLSNADLTNAHLDNVNLLDTDLTGANLSNADLAGSILSNSILTNADLTGANLIYAGMWNTNILRCNTLHLAKGLEAMSHLGPSSLDAETLRASIEHLPDIFLRGVGYNDEEIDVLRGLYGKAFRFYSCFISYARANNDFADRLFSDLQANGVTCWKDTEHMRGGDYYQSQITKAINVHDKVILICSQESLTKPAVISEILDAKSLQDKSGVLKLFPIRLDDFIFSDELKEIGKKETAEGNWPENWLAKVNAFHIPDFSHWKNHDAYQIAFQRLLKDLKAA